MSILRNTPLAELSRTYAGLRDVLIQHELARLAQFIATTEPQRHCFPSNPINHALTQFENCYQTYSDPMLDLTDNEVSSLDNGAL